MHGILARSLRAGAAGDGRDSRPGSTSHHRSPATTVMPETAAQGSHLSVVAPVHGAGLTIRNGCHILGRGKLGRGLAGRSLRGRHQCSREGVTR